jgi:hypothetical protein
MGDTKAKKIMNAIKDIHKLEGGMPHTLIQYRTEVLNDLFEKVKKKYSLVILAQINSAF